MSKDYRGIIYLCLAITVVAVLLTQFYFFESPEFLLKSNKAEEASKVLQKIHRVNDPTHHASLNTELITPAFSPLKSEEQRSVKEWLQDTRIRYNLALNVGIIISTLGGFHLF